MSITSLSLLRNCHYTQGFCSVLCTDSRPPDVLYVLTHSVAVMLTIPHSLSLLPHVVIVGRCHHSFHSSLLLFPSCCCLFCLFFTLPPHALMGLPAPPPPEQSTTKASSPSSYLSPPRRPAWHADPHGWIGLDNDKNKNNKASRTVFCTLQHLTSRADLNGHIAVVVGWEPSVQRYRVQLLLLSSSSKSNANNNNNHNNTVLSVAPDKVKAVTSPWRIWRAKLCLLQQEQSQIWSDARQALRQVLPVGILAGNRGPTVAQLDEALTVLLVVTVVLALVVTAIAWYYTGFTKTAVGVTSVLMVAVVLGPELLVVSRRVDDDNHKVSSVTARCRQRWMDFWGEMLGFQPTTTTAVALTTAWCAYVAYTMVML